MRYSELLLQHALEIIPTVDQSQHSIAAQRSISASYYALFHRINEDAARLIAPHVCLETSRRIQRWFEHAEMKKTCGRFLKEKLEQPLLGLVGDAASRDLQVVCRNFIALQEARHSADYDQGYAVDLDQTLEFFLAADDATKALARIADTAEANVFVLSLLLWKQWDKERA